MIYVIQRIDGAFVANPGSEHSYTHDITKARTFRTLEDAQLDACEENERAIAVEDLLQVPFR